MPCLSSEQVVTSPTPPVSEDSDSSSSDCRDQDEEMDIDMPHPSSPESLPDSSRNQSPQCPGITTSCRPAARRVCVVPGRRLRMRAFLEHLLDSGEVDGLEYICRTQRTFRLPWKHAKSTGYEAGKDGMLFKLWALNTGKLRSDGEMEDDQPIWKVNFRCALKNVQNTVVEIGDGPVDGDYKTFQFKDSELTEEESRHMLRDALPDQQQQPKNEQQQATQQDSTQPSFWPLQSQHGWQAQSPMRHSPPAQPRKLMATLPATATHNALPIYDPMSDANQRAGGMASVSGASPTTNQDYLDMVMGTGYASPLPNPRMSTAPAAPTVTQTHLHPAMINPPPMASPMVDPTLPVWPSTSMSPGASVTDMSPLHGSWDTQSSSISTFPQHYLDQILTIPTPQNLISYEMHVKVAYRSCAMAAMRVAHRDGCRLFYGQPPQPNILDPATQERLFGSKKLLQLSLPPPRTAQSILKSMWMVLENTHRGIILQMQNNDMFATRLCPASVYYQTQDGKVTPLERGKRTCVFSFQHFRETYERYRSLPISSGRLIACEPPCYEVLLSVGQHWGADRHRDNNLVSLNVTHCLGEKMIESLRQECFKQRAPFDTDYMSVDDANDDDRRAKEAMVAAVRGQLPKAVTGDQGTAQQSGSGVRNRGAGTAGTMAKNMRKSKEKRSSAKQVAKVIPAIAVAN